MNIVLVIFDTLRKDCIGAYGSPPWGKVHTPHIDAFARESLLMNRAYPESLPTLPTRRAIYTGRRVYPFHDADFNLKGDFRGAPGWGPIPEEQDTLAEILKGAGYRTALISDVYHMFKPSKNFARGFDQWTFLRGQEGDCARSGPGLTQSEINRWLPKKMQNDMTVGFIQACLTNMRDREYESDYFAPRVLIEASRWLEQNQDAKQFFLTVESFDPHEPWLVPSHYRKMYLKDDGDELVKSSYGDVSDMPKELLDRARANYSGLVTMCDRWFGYFMETMRVLGRLDDTIIIFTSDHGHSIGDNRYMGKRGYPSAQEVYDVPLMVRFPKAKHAGKQSANLVQHHDISAAILDLAKVRPREKMDGYNFIPRAISGKPGLRKHVTVGWGTTPTVITDPWWFNCKVDGTGVILHDLKARKPFSTNVAPKNRKVVSELFNLAEKDAAGGFPEWLMDLARKEKDAPGCSELAARSN